MEEYHKTLQQKKYETAAEQLGKVSNKLDTSTKRTYYSVSSHEEPHWTPKIIISCRHSNVLWFFYSVRKGSCHAAD